MFPIAGPVPHHDPKSSLPPQASASRAKEAAETASGAGAVSGMRPQEAPLAGYLMARASRISGPAMPRCKRSRISCPWAGRT
jgi:hypothetical protein